MLKNKISNVTAFLYSEKKKVVLRWKEIFLFFYEAISLSSQWLQRSGRWPFWVVAVYGSHQLQFLVNNCFSQNNFAKNAAPHKTCLSLNAHTEV